MGELGLGDGDPEIDAPRTQWTDTMVVEIDDDGTPVLVVSPEAPFQPSDVEVRRAHGGPEREYGLARSYWLLLAPTVAAVLSALVALTGPLGPGSSSGQSPILIGLVLLTVLLAGAADLWIYDDAAHLAAVDAAWQPSPWAYYAGGGLVLGLALAAWTGDPVGLLSNARAVGGVVVAGLVLSPVVTGPLYLYNRYRTVGLPRR